MARADENTSYPLSPARRYPAVVAAIALCLWAAGPRPAPAAPPRSQAAKQPAPAGFPLARLKELDSPKLSAVRKARLGLAFYREEMLHPTPRPAGTPGHPSTDIRTHDYVLARITLKLAGSGADPAALRSAWETANPGLVRDSLSILLLLRREPAAKEAVTALVENRQTPMRLRELAVTALGGHAARAGDPAVGRLFAQVIREDTHGVYRESKPADGKGEARLVIAYPVRRAAVDAIRRMEKEGILLESYVTAAASQARLEVPLRPPSAGSGSPGPAPNAP